jgi:hypothetical protein
VDGFPAELDSGSQFVQFTLSFYHKRILNSHGLAHYAISTSLAIIAPFSSPAWLIEALV